MSKNFLIMMVVMVYASTDAATHSLQAQIKEKLTKTGAAIFKKVEKAQSKVKHYVSKKVTSAQRKLDDLRFKARFKKEIKNQKDPITQRAFALQERDAAFEKKVFLEKLLNAQKAKIKSLKGKDFLGPDEQFVLKELDLAIKTNQKALQKAEKDLVFKEAQLKRVSNLEE